MTPAEILRNDFKLAVSPEGARCAELISLWCGGLHNFPGGERRLRKTDWNSFYVELLVRKSFATTDGNGLTRLVFLAHDLAIRADIGARMNYTEILLHPRNRIGDGMAKHPTLAEAIAEHEKCRRHKVFT